MLPAFLADLPLEDFEVLRHEVRRRLRAHDRAMAQKKRCPGCGESKALTEWGVNAGRRDGLQSHCRICMRAVRLARRGAAATRAESEAEEIAMRSTATDPCDAGHSQVQLGTR